MSAAAPSGEHPDGTAERTETQKPAVWLVYYLSNGGVIIVGVYLSEVGAQQRKRKLIAAHGQNWGFDVAELPVNQDGWFGIVRNDGTIGWDASDPTD